jgi:pentose-5-phosphate-3-epimerase
MDKDEALEKLEERTLPLEDVKAIFDAFSDDMQVAGQVAMNLSLRTSVYEPEKSAHPLMTELLVALSDAEDMGSRWAVAKNPHTPVEVLTKLAKDEINLVRALVATNPNTPAAVLQNLFSDEKIVRDGLSGNPNTPVKLLKILADDSDKMVRMRVAENPATPPEVLQRMMQDTEPNVAKAAEVNLAKRKEKA